MGHLDVNVQVRGSGAGDVQADINDEGNTSLVFTRRDRSQQRLLLQLQGWVAIAVESQTSIGIDGQGILGRVLLLAPQVVTHAVTSLGRVGERDSRVAHCNCFPRACEVLMGNLDVNVQVRGSGAGDVQGDVDDEGNASLVCTRGDRSQQRLLLQLQGWVAIAVESQTSI